MASLHVKKGDTVVVISGKEKGKEGKVLKCDPKNEKVLVEGINMLTLHKKPRNQQDAGGIIHQEGFFAASNVMVICPKCKKPTRTGSKLLEDGTRVRVCKKCGDTLDK